MWDEAARQASDMVHNWLSDQEEGSKTTSEDTRTLALHVLAFVGFQKSYPFKGVAKTSEVQHPLTYKDSLAIILKNVLVVIVLPAVVFRIPLLPAKWKQIGWAITQFKKYMLEQLAEERRLVAEGKPGSGTLISNLVRASQDVAGGDGARNRKDGKFHDTNPLTVDEILGNIFVFNFAGHDTTAISLAYSVLLLVAHPEVQDWIAGELNFYIESDKIEDWRYETTFPKLQRCLAVLVCQILTCQAVLYERLTCTLA